MASIQGQLQQSIKEERERPFKEKDVGDNLALQAFKEGVNKNSQTEPMDVRIDKAAQKASEAQDEAKRESTRGIKKAKGGSIKSASSRADGCAIRGKTRA